MRDRGQCGLPGSCRIYRQPFHKPFLFLPPANTEHRCEPRGEFMKHLAVRKAEETLPESLSVEFKTKVRKIQEEKDTLVKTCACTSKFGG